MFCIDTNIFIEFLRGNKDIIEKLNNANLEEIFITPITLCELYQGAYLSKNIDFKIKEIDDLISSFSLLEFNSDICKDFGNEYVKLRNSGKMIPEFDIIISSFVKVNNLILITRDNHFENTGIKIEVW